MTIQWLRQANTEQYPSSLDLSKIKSHLRVDHNFEDDIILLYAKAAAKHVEDYCNTPIIPSRYRMYFDSLPAYVELPLNTSSITQHIYTDVDGNIQMFDQSVYYVTNTTPRRIVYRNNAPKVKNDNSTMMVEVEAGFQVIPESYLAAIYLVTGALYENRESDSPINMFQIPSATRLLDSLRIPGVA